MPVDDVLGPVVFKRTFDGRTFWDALDLIAWLRHESDKRDSADLSAAANALNRTLVDNKTYAESPTAADRGHADA